MTPIEVVKDAIQVRAQGRFIFDSTDSELKLFSKIENIDVCKIRRDRAESGWRTILLAGVDYSSERIQAALHWAASVREQLPEPETSDLYMFLIVDGIEAEEAARIETDDRFCRKVVKRPSETELEMLDRTFLAALTPYGDTGEIGDPLQTALMSLSDKYPWTTPLLPKWRELLLSGKSGSELAKSLGEAFIEQE